MSPQNFNELDITVLAENLHNIFDDSIPWPEVEEELKKKWILIAEYVLQRESKLVYKSVIERVKKRQISRIEKRIKGEHGL